MSELISIIVPVYNVEKYLDKCIQSIIKQSYDDWELLLIDDGSTDLSGKICDSYAEQDNRIRVIHQDNRGRSGARNKGLENSIGKYIMFVDGDDWIDENCLDTAYTELKRADATMVVFRGRNIYSDHIEDEGGPEKVIFTDSEPLEFYIEGQKTYQASNTVWGKLYLKDLLRDIRFDESRYYEDVMFILQAYYKCTRCVYLDQAFYNYNVATQNSITAIGVNELTFRDEIPIFEEKELFLQKIGRDDLAERYSYFKYQRLLTYYKECMDVKARDYADRIGQILCRDRSKIRKLLSNEYVSKYYRLYFHLTLLCPRLGYMYVRGISKLVGEN